MEVYGFTSQLNNLDRRQQNITVSDERRSGIDRRTLVSNPFNVVNKRIDPLLKKDIEQVKDVFKKFKPDDKDGTSFTKELEVGAASSIPYVRRLNSVNNAVNNHDYFKALGTTALLFLNVKEDWRDILKIFKKPTIPREYQIPFSFVRGTPLEKIEILNKFDKTLDNTLIGKFILNKTGLKSYEVYFDNTLKKQPVIALKAKGNLITKILARSFMRIPVLSLLFLSMLEIPSIIHSEDKHKQAIKSTITVTSIIAGSALFGAIGASLLGPVGSLAGIGMGSYYASKIANKIIEIN
jgi:hypothetical protein